ncbi:MAG: hypothetical protein FWD76_05585 [Firmicutes bacterium]|nr:hypothetical protein [Bacillota bacterium]
MKAKRNKTQRLPENYANSLNFLEHMFAPSTATTVDNFDLGSSKSKKKKETAIELSPVRKNKRVDNKFSNIKNPLSKPMLAVFFASFLLIALVLSIVFITIAQKNDSDDQSNDTSTQSIILTQDSQEETTITRSCIHPLCS